MYETLGVCEGVSGTFPRAGSYDGVPGWEESLTLPRPAPQLQRRELEAWKVDVTSPRSHSLAAAKMHQPKFRGSPC